MEIFTAQSSALYSIESATSDIVKGGRDLWFSDGTEGELDRSQ